MKEVSLKSLKIVLNFIKSKNNPYENQIVGSIGPKCCNSKKTLFFDIMPKVEFLRAYIVFLRPRKVSMRNEGNKAKRKYIVYMLRIHDAKAVVGRCENLLDSIQ